MQNLWNHFRTAEYLDISPHSVRGKVSRGEIPYIKIGRSVRFDPDEIIAWAKKQERQPKREADK